MRVITVLATDGISNYMSIGIYKNGDIMDFRTLEQLVIRIYIRYNIITIVFYICLHYWTAAKNIAILRAVVGELRHCHFLTV